MVSKGILTKGPKDILFRSRLEAKWAYIFDKLGWEWEYEPIDLNGYIPDFILTNFHEEVLVEVKPVLRKEEFQKYTEKIINSGWEKEFLILGAKYFSFNNVEIGLLQKGNNTQKMSQLIYCNFCKSIYFTNIKNNCQNCNNNDYKLINSDKINIRLDADNEIVYNAKCNRFEIVFYEKEFTKKLFPKFDLLLEKTLVYEDKDIIVVQFGCKPGIIKNRRFLTEKKKLLFDIRAINISLFDFLDYKQISKTTNLIVFETTSDFEETIFNVLKVNFPELIPQWNNFDIVYSFEELWSEAINYVRYLPKLS